ncbi:uncharacterized protein [Diadema antillarum]|uniref:uncharacterized protein n=1 Tax=Diadema antillarum TaxID=105358 RepID=UPI003A84304D
MYSFIPLLFAGESTNEDGSGQGGVEVVESPEEQPLVEAGEPEEEENTEEEAEPAGETVDVEGGTDNREENTNEADSGQGGVEVVESPEEQPSVEPGEPEEEENNEEEVEPTGEIVDVEGGTDNAEENTEPEGGDEGEEGGVEVVESPEEQPSVEPGQTQEEEINEEEEAEPTGEIVEVEGGTDNTEDNTEPEGGDEGEEGGVEVVESPEEQPSVEPGQTQEEENNEEEEAEPIGEIVDVEGGTDNTEDNTEPEGGDEGEEGGVEVVESPEEQPSVEPGQTQEEENNEEEEAEPAGEIVDVEGGTDNTDNSEPAPASDDDTQEIGQSEQPAESRTRDSSRITLRGNFEADEPRNVEIDIKPAGKLRSLKIWGTITKYALRTCISEDFSDETCSYVRDDGGDIKTFTADEDENKVQLSQFEIDNVYGVVIEIIEAAEGQCNVRYRITLDKKAGKESPQIGARTCTRFLSRRRGTSGQSSRRGSQGNNDRSSRSGSSRRESQVTLRGNFEADEPRNVEIDIKPAGKLRSLKIWGTITKYALRTCISEDFSDETCPYVRDDGGDIKTFTADEDENKVQLSQFEIDNVYGVVIEIIEAAEGQCNVRYRITLDKKAGNKSPQIGARTCTRFPSRRGGNNDRSSRSGSSRRESQGTITKYALRTCFSEDFSDETCPYVRDDGGDIKTFTADEDENKVQLSQFEIDNVYGVVIEIIEAAEGQCNVRYRITLDKKAGEKSPQIGARTCTRFPSRRSGSNGRSSGRRSQGSTGQSSRRGSQGSSGRSSRSGSQVTLRGNFQADEPRNVEIDIKPAGKLRNLKIWGTITKYALRTCISEDFSDETCPYVRDDGGDIKTFTADEDENKVQLSQFEIDNVYGVVIEIIEAAEGQFQFRTFSGR